MGFCVWRSKAFCMFAGYKFKPGLVEKEELDFCWIWINALILLSTIHHAHERRKWKADWGEPGATFSELSRWIGTFHFVSSEYLHFACSLYNLPKRLPHFRKLDWDILNCLPQICSLLVLCLAAGGLLQCGHGRKATYYQSKHRAVRG